MSVRQRDTSRVQTRNRNLESGREMSVMLLASLDHYFAAEYEQAINVWTRALFLDRSHARARAYIERARSASSGLYADAKLLQNSVAPFRRQRRRSGADAAAERTEPRRSV